MLGMLSDDPLESAAKKINRAIKALLDSDPANSHYMAKLDGSRILAHCEEPAFQLLVQFSNQSLELQKPLGQAEDHVDLMLTGTAIGLLKLATTYTDQASALRESSISVNGDAGLLLELSQLAKHIEIDWEWLLAEKIGEAPAVMLSRMIKTGLQQAHKVTSDLSRKLTDDIQSNQQILPNKAELGVEKKRLRDLHYRLDRLEAKQINSTAELAP